MILSTRVFRVAQIHDAYTRPQLKFSIISNRGHGLFFFCGGFARGLLLKLIRSLDANDRTWKLMYICDPDRIFLFSLSFSYRIRVVR